MLILYAGLLEAIRLQNLVEAPSRVGLALLFVNGPVAAVIAGAVMAYPLAAIYGRYVGIMEVVVAVPVFAYSAPGILDADFNRLSGTIMVLEVVWLYVALRTVPVALARWMHISDKH